MGSIDCTMKGMNDNNAIVDSPFPLCSCAGEEASVHVLHQCQGKRMGDGVPNPLHQSDWWSARQRGPPSRFKEWSCEYFWESTFSYIKSPLKWHSCSSQWSMNLNIKESSLFSEKIFSWGWSCKSPQTFFIILMIKNASGPGLYFNLNLLLTVFVM